MKLNRKAFTIIELIVVVGIISVLASIVVFNVSSIRNRARDATIKENMSSFFKLASDYWELHGNYGGFCEYSEARKLFDSIPAFNDKKEKYCQHDSDEWMVCAQLNFPDDRSRAWCIDATGIRREISADDCKQGNKDCQS